MHAICVTSGVFQAGEGSTAHLEGTSKTACHICCGQRMDHQQESQQCFQGVGGHYALTGNNMRQAIEIHFIWFGDWQMQVVTQGANSILTWSLHLKVSDSIWRRCPSLSAGTVVPFSICEQCYKQHQKNYNCCHVSQLTIAVGLLHIHIHTYAKCANKIVKCTICLQTTCIFTTKTNRAVEWQNSFCEQIHMQRMWPYSFQRCHMSGLVIRAV